MPVDPADFMSADAPGTKPSPMLPPASAASSRKFLLLVDIRFGLLSADYMRYYDIGAKYAQERLPGQKDLEGFCHRRQCDKESGCDKQMTPTTQ
jgi:hypothetical protein